MMFPGNMGMNLDERTPMKGKRTYPRLIISKKGALWVKAGHPWIYEGEILGQEGPVQNGDLVDAMTEKGTYLGTGLLSQKSKIRIRLLSQNANDRFDEAFWKRRFSYAWAYRKQLMKKEDLQAVRIIFGESDGMPGLTVDRFNDLLSVQCLSYGMEKRKALLYPLLAEVLREEGEQIRGIYERNDDSLREKEGLNQDKGWFTLSPDQAPHAAPFFFDPPASPITEIMENGIRYQVDVAEGQKTGFFLDQKENRRRIQDLCQGRRVLDCFTHTGSFALNALRGGALEVCALDVSARAITMARKNAELNGVQEKIQWIVADAFDFLEEKLAKKDHPWDFIILDPPAFTKSRSTIRQAAKGYQRINALAMRILPRGSYLATCSCSHFMSQELFLKEVNQAAHEAGVRLKQIEFRQQAPDHPILIDVPETAYLKFFIFQVI